MAENAEAPITELCAVRGLIDDLFNHFWEEESELMDGSEFGEILIKNGLAIYNPAAENEDDAAYLLTDLGKKVRELRLCKQDL